jgi:hypothetical protein
MRDCWTPPLLVSFRRSGGVGKGCSYKSLVMLTLLDQVLHFETSGLRLSGLQNGE